MNRKEQDHLNRARDADFFENRNVETGSSGALGLFILTLAVGLTVGLLIGVSLENFWQAQEMMQ